VENQYPCIQPTISEDSTVDDRIEKTIDLKAPIDRVWCAVTDHKEFGTRLTIIESGFAALPDDADAAEALRRNAGGWEIQTQNIAAHVED
jgi:hypothetical protein